jgi:hypothetical protein
MENTKTEIKNTNELFQSLNISNSTLSDDQKSSLNDKGFVIFPPNEFMKKNLDELNKISENLIKSEGDKGGWEGKEKYYKEGKKI